MPEKKGTKGTGGEGKRSWNSCGSEARKGERKQTGKLSTGTGKERTGNQAGKNGEAQEAKAEREHRGSHCEAEAGRTERKKQKAE